jgi:succinyl-CoA synthetase beta subunit
MRLYEFEAKEVFQKYGLAIPKGQIVESAEEARRFASQIGAPVVTKPQVSTKKRGKAGVIRFASSPEEAFRQSQSILGMVLNHEKVSTLLVEEKIEIDKEFYVAMTIDYSSLRPVAIASPFGGVDIEEVAQEKPAMVKKVCFSISKGPIEKDFEELVSIFNQSEQILMKEVLAKLYRIFRDCDAEMVEINPLALTKHGKVVALDAFLNVDDDSLFRHSDLVKPRGMSQEEFEFEQSLKEKKWKYIEMDPDGEIGILSSGAGITMAILDLIKMRGGRPANFLDTAQMNAEGIYNAFSLFAGNTKLKVLLVNIFAGLNRCDDLAMGIKRYLQEHPLRMPLVIRMIGYREDEGKSILKEINVETIRSLEDSVEKVIQIAKGAR